MDFLIVALVAILIPLTIIGIVKLHYLHKQKKIYNDLINLSKEDILRKIELYNVDDKYLFFCNSLDKIIKDAINTVFEKNKVTNIPEIKIIFGGLNKIKNNLAIKAVYNCGNALGLAHKASKNYLAEVSNMINAKTDKISSEIVILEYNTDNKEIHE